MFEHCLYFNTSALARRLEREWADAFRPFDLTPPQAFMLRAVLRQPGLLQRELADELVISRPTTTRALDGLAAKGLVERRSPGKDGRESAVYPTAAAEQMGDALGTASAGVTCRLQERFGKEGFAELVLRLRSARDEME